MAQVTPSSAISRVASYHRTGWATARARSSRTASAVSRRPTAGVGQVPCRGVRRGRPARCAASRVAVPTCSGQCDATATSTRSQSWAPAAFAASAALSSATAVPLRTVWVAPLTLATQSGSPSVPTCSSQRGGGAGGQTGHRGHSPITSCAGFFHQATAHHDRGQGLGEGQHARGDGGREGADRMPGDEFRGQAVILGQRACARHARDEQGDLGIGGALQCGRPCRCRRPTRGRTTARVLRSRLLRPRVSPAVFATCSAVGSLGRGRGGPGSWHREGARHQARSGRRPHHYFSVVADQVGQCDCP